MEAKGKLQRNMGIRLEGRQNSYKAITARDITAYSPLKVNRGLGGTYRLHFQDQRLITKRETSVKQVASRACIIVRP
jgi:hypothetical protein